MESNDHVVINGEERVIRCLGCQASQPFRLPISVTEFVYLCRKFECEHALCRHVHQNKQDIEQFD